MGELSASPLLTFSKVKMKIDGAAWGPLLVKYCFLYGLQSQSKIQAILIATSLKRHQKLVRWSGKHHGNGSKWCQMNMVFTFVRSLRLPCSNSEHRWLDLKACPKWDSSNKWARRNEVGELSQAGTNSFLSSVQSLYSKTKQSSIKYYLPNFKIFLPFCVDALCRVSWFCVWTNKPKAHVVPSASCFSIGSSFFPS